MWQEILSTAPPPLFKAHYISISSIFARAYRLCSTYRGNTGQQTIASLSVNTNRSTTGRSLDANQSHTTPGSALGSDGSFPKQNRVQCVSGLRSVCVRSSFCSRPLSMVKVCCVLALSSLCVHAASTRKQGRRAVCAQWAFTRSSRCVRFAFLESERNYVNAVCTQSANWLHATEDIHSLCVVYPTDILN